MGMQLRKRGKKKAFIQDVFMDDIDEYLYVYEDWNVDKGLEEKEGKLY